MRNHLKKPITILLTNDDGINAPGIIPMRDALAKIGKVTVVAPSEQKSAISHSITLYQPLIVSSSMINGIRHYAVEGTTADCVKLAISRLMKKKPDLVVSGINFGVNTGSNVHYSGTVSGAMEASMFEILSFAVSLKASQKPDFKRTADIALKLVMELFEDYHGQNVVFNVNFPEKKPRGVKITHQEFIPYVDSFDRRRDPRGRTYYWLRGSPERGFLQNIYKKTRAFVMSDAMAVAKGYISITPLKRDLTNYDILNTMKVDLIKRKVKL